MGALLIWITFIGGLLAYTQQHRPEAEGGRPVFTPPKAEGRFSVTVTTTFAAEPDPFALTAGTTDPPAALMLRMGRRVLLQVTDRLSAAWPVSAPLDEGLNKGINEIYFEAYPSLNDAAQAQAVRLELFKNDQRFAEKTFWSSPGGKVADIFRFTIDPGLEADKHEHS
jgi:hypothetical protein